MLIKEYHILLPLSVEEYRVAQLYMIARKAREESEGEGSGVEILQNEPYSDGPGGSGQYTKKHFHIGSHLPSWMKSILPKTALIIEEEAWNAYPYTRTIFRCPFIDKFSLDIETKYVSDAGTTGNIFNLDKSTLGKRVVDVIDLEHDTVPEKDYKVEEDPQLFVSKKTGRGPLGAGWYKQNENVMCAYKLCRVEFKYWGLQQKIENFIHLHGLRNVMVRAHRQVWCWQDEWVGLTMADVRQMEIATQTALQNVMQDASASSGNEQTEKLERQNSCIIDSAFVINDEGDATTTTAATAAAATAAAIDTTGKNYQNLETGQLIEELSDEDEFFDCSEDIRNSMLKMDSTSSTVSSHTNEHSGDDEEVIAEHLLLILHGPSLIDPSADDSLLTSDMFKSTFQDLIFTTYGGQVALGAIMVHYCEMPLLHNRILEGLQLITPHRREDRDAVHSSVLVTEHIDSESWKQIVVPEAVTSLNNTYRNFVTKNANFVGKIHIVADALGGLATFEALTNESVQLEFSVSNFFSFGSPIGLALLHEKNASVKAGETSWMPLKPRCNQFYNVFMPADPLAFRVEPLLDSRFHDVVPTAVPRHQDYPLGMGAAPLVDSVLLKYKIHFAKPLSSWWGTYRIDYAIDYPEPLDRTPDIPLLHVLRAGYPSSRNAVAFVCREIFRSLDISRRNTNVYFGKITPFNVMPPKVKWNRRRTRIKKGTAQPNHRGLDIICTPFSTQRIKAIFAYGLLDSKIISGEDVAVYILETPNGPWTYIGDAQTKEARNSFSKRKKRTSSEHSGILNNEMTTETDAIHQQTLSKRSPSDGMVDYFPKAGCHVSTDDEEMDFEDLSGSIDMVISEKHRLPVGTYPVKCVVRGDSTMADCNLFVVHPHTQAVVFSIDGSFAKSVSITGSDPKVREGAVDMVRIWSDKGYLIIYISARPDIQQLSVGSWLAKHNFPHGIVRLNHKVSYDVVKHKVQFLSSLQSEPIGLDIVAAYGSPKDINSYHQVGLDQSRIFVVQSGKSNRSRATVLFDGYGQDHLDWISSVSDARVCAPSMSKNLLRSCEVSSGSISTVSSDTCALESSRPVRRSFSDTPRKST